MTAAPAGSGHLPSWKGGWFGHPGTSPVHILFSQHTSVLPLSWSHTVSGKLQALEGPSSFLLSCDSAGWALPGQRGVPSALHTAL